MTRHTIHAYHVLYSSNQNTSAVPFLPDGYTTAEWQEEHEAELAQLQAKEEEFIGHRGTASQPVRHLTEDLDEQTVVHFHKPAAVVSGGGCKSGTSEETVLQKMRRRWGRDDDEVVPWLLRIEYTSLFLREKKIW